MCGFIVWFGSKQCTSLDLSVLRHRGPDDHGEWRSSDGRVLMGHTRLSIIDTSVAGRQPMLDEEGELALVFNGEIYNHREIRAKIIAERPSVTWRGRSDSETILRAWSLWKDGCVAQLRGMFAFVIADLAQQTVTVVRDRFGIKPLYYFQSENGIAIASEVRALLMFMRSMRLSTTGLVSYLAYGCCGEESLIEDVKEVPPATVKVFTLEGSTKTTKYWPRAQLQKPRERTVAIKEIRRLLDLSVREHLESDVPVSVFLSGGVDSSIIAALAVRAVGRQKLEAFTIGFDQQEYDETHIAAQVASCHGLKHRIVKLKESDILQAVLTGVEAMDLPTVDGLNTFLVSRVVAQAGYKVVLSGIGGDELFGGYPSFRDVPRLLKMYWAFGLLRFFGAVSGNGKWSYLKDLPSAEVGLLAMWRRKIRCSEFLVDLNVRAPLLEYEEKWHEADIHSQISWTELRSYMRHMLLRDADQMGMACGLEIRVPFLDHRLVECALACPYGWHRKQNRPKALLLDAFGDLLPQSVLRLPKRGFTLPMLEWIRGPLNDHVRAGVKHTSERIGLSLDVIERIFTDVLKGRRHWTTIWQIAVLGHWLHRVDLRKPELVPDAR